MKCWSRRSSTSSAKRAAASSITRSWVARRSRRGCRVMLIGFFEGIESERGIAWRVADSLCLRQFLQIGLDERTPDHVTISRTRRLMDEATHLELFGWVLRQVARAGLLRGKTIGI